jgi:hypothetical protein
MKTVSLTKSAVFVLIVITISLFSAQKASAGIDYQLMNSGSISPVDTSGTIVKYFSQGSVILSEVPTSTWTYGCSATSAGMMFGYYDRIGYDNMYTGPANGGIAPLYDIGANCSIIATKKGFDGRTTRGHVDDYWQSVGATGDPYIDNWVEHEWENCTADFMGTSQWKWDVNNDNSGNEYCADGATLLWSYSSENKLYDYVPPESYGPQTSLCHGLRLFAESRGYEVLQNYTQKIDAKYEGGFSITDFIYQIDTGRPVMIQLEGHSMVGVGYKPGTDTIYVHDTWDNNVHEMTWGASYAGMLHNAVTVLELEAVPEPATAVMLIAGMLFFTTRYNTCTGKK